MNARSVAGQKRPAAKIGAVRLRIAFQHVRRIALRRKRDCDEANIGVRCGEELALHCDQLRGQDGAHVFARSEDERDGDDFTAQIAQR
jgi:hypothetical protein